MPLTERERQSEQEGLKDTEVTYHKVKSINPGLNPVFKLDGIGADDVIDEVKALSSTNALLEVALKTLIPQGVDQPKPVALLEFDGIPVFTKRSISTVIGKAKAGKTSVLAWIVAQLLRLGKTVLWIDTEQGGYYASRTQYWVLQVAGLTSSEYLKYHDLRALNPTKRAEFTSLLVSHYQPDMVIIDGVKDLVFDINNTKEAGDAVTELLLLCEKENCHILSIIHQNSGNDKARGHLGTELINKSEVVIEVSKDKDKQITICKSVENRNKEFHPMAFIRDANGIPIKIDGDVEISADDNRPQKFAKIDPISIPRSTHHEILTKAFTNNDKLSSGELISALMAAYSTCGGNSLGEVKAKQFKNFYIQEGYIKQLPKTSNSTFFMHNKS